MEAKIVAQVKELKKLPIDVIIYREDDMFTARCLLFDLVQTASTVEQARCDIEDVIKAHIEYAIENDNMEYLIKPSPPKSWSMFYNARLEGKPLSENSLEGLPNDLSTMRLQTLTI